MKTMASIRNGQGELVVSSKLHNNGDVKMFSSKLSFASSME